MMKSLMPSHLYSSLLSISPFLLAQTYNQVTEFKFITQRIYFSNWSKGDLDEPSRCLLKYQVIRGSVIYNSLSEANSL